MNGQGRLALGLCGMSDGVVLGMKYDRTTNMNIHYALRLFDWRKRREKLLAVWNMSGPNYNPPLLPSGNVATIASLVSFSWIGQGRAVNFAESWEVLISVEYSMDYLIASEGNFKLM